MGRYFSGVRGRVMLTVIAVTAALYSVLGVVGFLLIANSGRDAIRERITQVLDQLERGLRDGSSTVQINTPDGVQARLSGSSTPVAGVGVIDIVRHATIEGASITLVGEASQARLTDSLRSLHRGLWIGVPLAVAVTGVMAGIATGRALRPVADITELADTIRGGDALARVPIPDTGDEIEHLARTVNEMLDRIGAGVQAQRQFTSDAAHELRTPLMAMQGEIEIAATHPEAADDQLLERLAALAERLGARVDDLVLLSALDESRPMDTTATSLMSLVRDEATGVDQSIEVDGDEAAVVTVEGRLVARAVRNLLSNAHRHADSLVKVSVVQGDGRVWVHVDDDGQGVESRQREQIFRRFGRLDEARSLDSGGSGLGLAIVASVARAHGGDVGVEPSPLGGARFSLWLPSAADTERA